MSLLRTMRRSGQRVKMAARLCSTGGFAKVGSQGSCWRFANAVSRACLTGHESPRPHFHSRQVEEEEEAEEASSDKDEM